MRTVERRLDSRVPVQDPSMRPRAQSALALTRRWLAARFSPLEWALLAILVVVPVAFMWHWASPSYFFWDDLGHFYWARNSGALLPYAFEPSWGHLAPAYRLAYLALDRIAPMNFEVALTVLLACHLVSAVLLQRILTLLFGRVWWTFALALAWAISVAYVPAFAWFAAGLHSITAITATLASIHGYLCWRASGRRTWLAWSLVAMTIGLGFYVKALLIPLYLVLMRALLLDPAARLRDSLRSLLGEWRVWFAYATVCVSFLLVYSLGDYSRPEGGATVGDVLRYLRVFWIEGFSPIVFGVRVPLEHGDWHQVAIVAVQVALVGLFAWSIERRRAAWRAWAFLLVAGTANALMVVGRVSQLGAEVIGYHIYYYTEPTLLVALAIPFAFATPRLSARVKVVKSAAPAMAPASAMTKHRFRLPRGAAGPVALLALAAYMGVTWATANSVFKSGGTSPEEIAIRSGHLARTYFDNLRSDVAAARRGSVQLSLLDHDVPEPIVPQLNNLETAAIQAGLRFTLLSSTVPLVDEQVTFNQPGPLHIVGPDGHLQRTRFVPAAGGSPSQLRRGGRLRIHEARLEHRRGEWCVVAEGLGALEWEPRPHLRGRDWWLRAHYRTDPVEAFALQTNPGVGWIDDGRKLPPMGFPGTAIIDLGELPDGTPTNAGVRLGVPPFGRLCLRSLEIGSFDPPPPSPEAGFRVSP